MLASLCREGEFLTKAIKTNERQLHVRHTYERPVSLSECSICMNESSQAASANLAGGTTKSSTVFFCRFILSVSSTCDEWTHFFYFVRFIPSQILSQRNEKLVVWCSCYSAYRETGRVICFIFTELCYLQCEWNKWLELNSA